LNGATDTLLIRASKYWGWWNNKWMQGLLQFSSPFRGSAIGSTPAFGAGYPGSSPGPGASFLAFKRYEVPFSRFAFRES